MVELIDFVSSVIIFLSQTTLLRRWTFLLGSLTVTLSPAIINFLAFVHQWLSLNWGILIMLSQFPLTFLQTHKGVPLFIAQFMTILVVTGMVFVIIWVMFRGMVSLNLVHYVSGSKLELMNIFLIEQKVWFDE